MDRRRVVAIVQARMASSRLPGKVLADIGGQPMLVRVLERARRASRLALVVVATSTEKDDDAVVALCADRAYDCYRGDPLDVLDRYVQTARRFEAEVIVRLTGDCPLIDPEVIDRTVAAFLEANPPVDFAANRLPAERTFPIGLDTEVCSRTALELAGREAAARHHREHVMPFFYENPNRFRTLLVHNDVDYGHLRWTVDTQEDLVLVREIYAQFAGKDHFSWMEVLDLYERQPRLAEINASVAHKTELDLDPRWNP
ncbi:MAG TPA: glycosyltransferase family protein [Anaerolineales bacterium]|nr:glycosyltransferase family protein [Anaerolineales bacterium]